MFLIREKKYLETLKSDIDLTDYFPSEILSYLHEIKRIHQIFPKVFISIFCIFYIILKVLIRPPVGKGENKIQFAEIVIPHTGFKLSNMINNIVDAIDDPFRIYFSLSMICHHGQLSE